MAEKQEYLAITGRVVVKIHEPGKTESGIELPQGTGIDDCVIATIKSIGLTHEGKRFSFARENGTMCDFKRGMKIKLDRKQVQRFISIDTGKGVMTLINHLDMLAVLD